MNAEERKCPRCSANSRVANGLCLGCLLQVGTENDENLQLEDFDAALAAVSAADTNWRIGNYEILVEIARGGMGVIYRARQRHSRRIVALKRVLSHHADSRDTLVRFRREAEAAASLDHPNILPIYEVGASDDGVPFFSMKYAPGGSLQEAGPLLRDNPREIVRLLAKVTRAVQYAHRQGILHRDLKPGNVLLDGRGEPLVSDFGLAKWLETSSDITRTLTIFGTPGFIAPEQAEGKAADLKAAADIYSLGAILFNLLAARPPFLGGHALSVIHQAAERPAPKLRSLVGGVDRDLETICARCLERDPEARYRSAGDLAQDLEWWLEGRPIIARPVSPPARVWRWNKRNPLVAGAMAMIFAILLAATAVSLYQREAALESNKALHLTLQHASLADLEAARQRFRAGAWREGIALLGRSLDFWPENQDAAKYLLSSIAFGHGDRDKLPIFGIEHKGAINNAAFSRDGRYFATASYDNTAKIWNAANGVQIGKTLQHVSDCLVVSFSPDGRRLVTGSDDGMVMLWDAQTGQSQTEPIHHDRPDLDSRKTLRSAVISSDGTRILTGSLDHTARLWDAASGKEIAQLVNPQRVADAVFSPDGTRILTSYWYGGAILWDAITFQPIGAPMQHAATVRKSRFTPDGNKIVTSSLDKTARIWDGHTAKPLSLPSRHDDFVWDLDISPDGKLFATASYDKTVRLWSTADGTPVGVPMQHAGPVDTVAFSPDGKRLVTASRDKTVRLWDTATCQEIGNPMRHDATVLTAMFTPMDANKVLSVGWDDAAYLWDAQAPSSPGEIIAVPGEVCSIDFAEDNDRLFVTTRDGKAGIWSLGGRKFVTPIILQADPIVLSAFHSASKQIATANRDGVVRFWNAASGRTTGETKAVTDTIMACAFAADGHSVFAAYLSGSVLQWKIPEGRQIGPVMKHSEKMDALAIAPSGQEIATGCRDDYLYLWKTPADETPPIKIRHTNPVFAVSYSPDGRFIATGSDDHTARIWSLANGQQSGDPIYVNARATAVHYTAAGKALLVGSVDDTEVNCYDTKTHDSQYFPLPHSTGVSHVTANATGSLVVTVTNDGVARLWRIPDAFSESLPKWLPDYLRALGGLTFTAKQQLVDVPTRARLALRKKLLDMPADSSVWDSMMRSSLQR